MADIPADLNLRIQSYIDKLYESGGEGDIEGFRETWDSLTPEFQMALYTNHPEMKAIVDKHVWPFRSQVQQGAGAKYADYYRELRTADQQGDAEGFRDAWNRLSADEQRTLLDENNVSAVGDLWELSGHERFAF